LAFLKNISDSGGSDQELVALYKRSGDKQMLATLYQRYIDLAYGVCLKYLKQPDAAKDAVMAVFEDLLSKLKKHEVTHFKSWLFAVVKNHCLMQLRSENRFRMVDLDADRMQLEQEVHLQDAWENERQLKQLSDCVEGLSEAQKTSITLFYFRKKCYKEISVITGHDPEKVRSLIQNGRRNLKICMEQKVQSPAHE
jgi:RNA polymerase sigma factor (sigma-70 family)